MAECLCRTCGKVFGGLRAFDQHLRWVDGPPWVKHCEPPETQYQRGDGVWVRRYGSTPETAA